MIIALQKSKNKFNPRQKKFNKKIGNFLIKNFSIFLFKKFSIFLFQEK